MSDFKGTGVSRRRRRWLQPAGKAPGTGAKRTQKIECIQAGAVIVAPGEMQRIVADQFNIHPFHGGRNAAGNYSPFPR